MQQQQLGFGYNLYDFDFGGDGYMQSNFGMRLQLPVERANHLRFGLCKYKQQYQSLRRLQLPLQYIHSFTFHQRYLYKRQLSSHCLRIRLSSLQLHMRAQRQYQLWRTRHHLHDLIVECDRQLHIRRGL